MVFTFVAKRHHVEVQKTILDTNLLLFSISPLGFSNKEINKVELRYPPFYLRKARGDGPGFDVWSTHVIYWADFYCNLTKTSVPHNINFTPFI